MKVLFVLRPGPLTPGAEDREQYVNKLASRLRGRGINTYIKVLESADNAHEIRSILREIRPQVVQVEDWPQIVRPIRQTFNGQLLLNLHSLTSLASMAIPRRELRVALCLVDKVVLVSHFLKSLFIGRFYGLRLRTAVIHPGVDADEFRPVTAEAQFLRERVKLRRSWGVESSDVVALAAHIPHPDTGLDIILRAWPTLKTKPRLVIAGSPSELQGAGDGIIHVGQIPPSGMPGIYRAVDLFLYPSQGREPLGRANLEAMAAGLPIIASLRGGVAELVDNKCGYLVRQYADVDTWSRAIDHVVGDPTLRERLSQGGILQSHMFSWEKCAAAFMQLYSGV